jgi:hypothetical protein
MTKRHHTSFLLLRLIFPILYAGFFVVQLFVNFDNAFLQGNDRFLFIKSLDHHSTSVAIEKGKPGQSLKSKFRLNKRFQPAEITILPFLSYKPVVTFICIKRVAEVSCFKTDFLLETRSLRGPPSIV